MFVQTIARQLAEILLRGMCEQSYWSPLEDPPTVSPLDDPTRQGHPHSKNYSLSRRPRVYSGEKYVPPLCLFPKFHCYCGTFSFCGHLFLTPSFSSLSVCFALRRTPRRLCCCCSSASPWWYIWATSHLFSLLILLCSSVPPLHLYLGVLRVLFFRPTETPSWAGFLNTTTIASSVCSRPLWCMTCWL